MVWWNSHVEVGGEPSVLLGRPLQVQTELTDICYGEVHNLHSETQLYSLSAIECVRKHSACLTGQSLVYGVRGGRRSCEGASEVRVLHVMKMDPHPDTSR